MKFYQIPQKSLNSMHTTRHPHHHSNNFFPPLISFSIHSKCNIFFRVQFSTLTFQSLPSTIISTSLRLHFVHKLDIISLVCETLHSSLPLFIKLIAIFQERVLSRFSIRMSVIFLFHGCCLVSIMWFLPFFVMKRYTHKHISQ
jgi:hypothetical protein